MSASQSRKWQLIGMSQWCHAVPDYPCGKCGKCHGPQGGLRESGNLVRAFEYQKMFNVVQCPRGLAKAFIILV